MTNLTKHKSRAYSDIEEGLLNLSAGNEGLITLEADGSFKDTPKLTAIIEALEARAATIRTDLRLEGLDIKLDPRLSSMRDATTAYHTASLAMEACASMLTLTHDAQLDTLAAAVEEQLESSSDALVDAAFRMDQLSAV
jgi:hypothetical protein